jgi:geranylgeranyl reductase family protein
LSAVIRLRQEYCDVDVAIAGAGPAGAAAAAHLARTGLRVVLLDQQRFPRDKVCGDFVSPVALDELRCLGVTRLPGYADTQRINEAGLFLDGRQLLSRPFPYKPPLPPYGRVIPRMQLDAWIVEVARLAGARLIQGCRVQSYTVEEHGVRVDAAVGGRPMSIRARLLIGADGSSSTIARQLRGRGLEPRDRIVAVRAYYRGVRGPADRADIYFMASCFPGYFWVFPTGDGTANVGVGVALDTLPPSDVKLRELMLQLIATDEALQERLDGAEMTGKVVGWPLATWNPHLPLLSERVLLVGDAANLINPINGEGIQTALLSARWAAETAHACARQDDFSEAALQPYAARVHGELRYDMALSCFIVQCIRNGVLNPMWLQLLRVIADRATVDDEYADIAGGILAGIVPASSALGPKIILGTLQQALLSLGAGALDAAVRGDPAAIVSAGLSTALFGAHTILSAVRDPDAWVRWILYTAAGAAELMAQASLDALTPLLTPPDEQRPEREPRLLLS